ncbi:carboxypeptidase-like regulatory domain-containing protein [Tautonia sociabilis]|uniref:Carboxypeptidase regulatory-like domain-containing protein n=1 Tax=Tautonia sociabilis TaxID=2080755 RepID=A0A432MMK4_9BACT|nr:carboxypeptidase-like regulatory domain-containing protein [Tautonia sociabilis]RUL88671.1 hypothetical protein TsocGM_05910 [Tautonia sociabilis]
MKSDGMFTLKSQEHAIMAINRRRLGAMAAAALLSAGAGCGGGRPDVDSAMEEVMVSGRVTIDGKPAAGSTITFDPSNVERRDAQARSTQINDDGTYTISTLIGQNRVSFSGGEIGKYPEIINGASMHELQRGENTLNFDLPLEQDLSGG